MCVVAHNSGRDDDGPMEGVRWGPLERDRGERVPGVTVSHRPLVDSIASHVAADGGQAGVLSAEGNVPTPDGVVLSVGCKVSAYQVL